MINILIIIYYKDNEAKRLRDNLLLFFSLKTNSNQGSGIVLVLSPTIACNSSSVHGPSVGT